jgi:hypothetical protein
MRLLQRQHALEKKKKRKKIKHGWGLLWHEVASSLT